jgi:S-adenosylmethionine hydrolase
MRPVALLTDFGHDDHYVGVLHAVLEREAPGVTRIDLGHGVKPGDIWDACFQLRCAWPHLPADCVVMVVVDPGVGTGRRAVAVTVGSRVLVAPDNGIAAAVTGASVAVTLNWRRMGLEEPSRTFHARDLFAPAAARLACNASDIDVGDEIDVASLLPCPLPEPGFSLSGLEGVIVHVDHFGNLVTNVRASQVEASATATWRAGRTSRRVGTYGEAQPEEVVLIEGSAGFLELAVNCGSAAEATGLERGDAVVFSVGNGNGNGNGHGDGS